MTTCRDGKSAVRAANLSSFRAREARARNDSGGRDTHLRIPAARCTRVLQFRSAPKKIRGRGEDGCAPHPRSRVQTAQGNAHTQPASTAAATISASWNDSRWSSANARAAVYISNVSGSGGSTRVSTSENRFGGFAPICCLRRDTAVNSLSTCTLILPPALKSARARSAF